MSFRCRLLPHFFTTSHSHILIYRVSISLYHRDTLSMLRGVITAFLSDFSKLREPLIGSLLVKSEKI